MCKISSNTTAYNSTKHLLRRLDKDMLTCHHQMEVPKNRLQKPGRFMGGYSACPQGREK